MAKEYDVEPASWKVYEKLYKTNIEHWELISGVRPFIETTFKYKNLKSKKLKFSGETDFNFSNQKIFGLGRSHYEHFRKILQTEMYSEHIEMPDICQ